MTRKKKIAGYRRPIKRIDLHDVPAIQRAKRIIESDFVSHIQTLTGKASINECKLKFGFRELFNPCPCKYRLHLCFEKTKALSEETVDTIDQIALKQGFEPSNGFWTPPKKPVASTRQHIGFFNLPK
jgi:AraC-like DNA-binding protein